MGQADRLTVHKPPVEQGIIDKGLQDSHDAVPMLPQHLHHRVAGDAVVTVQACHLAANQKQIHRLRKLLQQKGLRFGGDCLRFVEISLNLRLLTHFKETIFILF